MKYKFYISIFFSLECPWKFHRINFRHKKRTPLPY
nr:MAG TPA: hypothetical protein [Caudoviricetes sp.]